MKTKQSDLIDQKAVAKIRTFLSEKDPQALAKFDERNRDCISFLCDSSDERYAYDTFVDDIPNMVSIPKEERYDEWCEVRKQLIRLLNEIF